MKKLSLILLVLIYCSCKMNPIVISGKVIDKNYVEPYDDLIYTYNPQSKITLPQYIRHGPCYLLLVDGFFYKIGINRLWIEVDFKTFDKNKIGQTYLP